MDRNRTVHGRSSAQIVIGRQIASTTKDAPLSILSSTTRTRSIQSIWSSKGIIGQITTRLRSRLLLLSYGHCCHDHRHSSQSLLPLVLLVHLLLLLVRGAAKTIPCERPTPVARTSTMLLPPPSQFFGSTSVLLPPPTSPVPDDATMGTRLVDRGNCRFPKTLDNSPSQLYVRAHSRGVARLVPLAVAPLVPWAHSEPCPSGWVAALHRPPPWRLEQPAFWFRYPPRKPVVPAHGAWASLVKSGRSIDRSIASSRDANLIFGGFRCSTTSGRERQHKMQRQCRSLALCVGGTGRRATALRPLVERKNPSRRSNRSSTIASTSS
jgi:hypothetical protein